MSSDEELLDPFYINYQRRLDGQPPQQDSSKGKQRASNYGTTNAGMDWKKTNEPVSTTRAETTSSQKDDDDSDTVLYSDPDDRTPTPPVGDSKPNDRPLLQNVKFPESRFRTPLRNLNTRGRAVHSSTRGRGRNFGPSRPAIPHRNRNNYVPPHRPTQSRQSLPRPQYNVPRGRSPGRPTAIPDLPDIPEPYFDEPFQQPRPARHFAPPYRLRRPPETIRLTDGSHYFPEREDVKWSNRKYEKTSGRFNRKSKGVAFFDTFEGTFAPPRVLRFGPQRRSRERGHSSEDDNAEENCSDEENVRYEEDEPAEVSIQDVGDDAAIDNDIEEVTVMSPPPNLQPKQLYQARKLVIQISDDSEPESVEDSAGPISDGGSSSGSSIEVSEPEPMDPPLLPESMSRPPDAIFEALRPILPTFLCPSLPFLRRNLRQSFYHAFVRHIAQQQRPMPKIPSYESQPPTIWWKYRATPGANEWQIVQEGWSCQLCNYFPPFALGSALMYHLRRDHPPFFARRKKLGFRRWSITITLSKRVLPAPKHLIHTREFSSLASSIEPTSRGTDLEDGDQSDDLVEQLTVAMMELDTDGEVRRYRVGGIGCYDLAMQEITMPLKGLAGKAFEGRENDVCFYPKCSDREKAMAIIWGRWINQHRLEFIRNPLKNAVTFIDKHWDIIRRTAEQEGLIKWLLTMKFHRYFTQAQVAQLSKRYQRHLP